ncbi:hypothetical protein OZ668_05770 [Elizabethkingia sp. HX XZB]|uniref:hypothetical protein n=1 Tax=Elizabethkingia sp. HX XZB TaxID=3003193 RepID=UPI002A23E1AA|nr:hypothetical protein [Elizabethkingia sp. HX XZB]MDX8567481.1 hypothetical protein [Elizabethkingia sp. HX XZB]
MTKNLFYLLPIFILLFSYRNSDNESDIKTEQEFLVKKISPLFSPEGHMLLPSSETKKNFEFEYDSKNRLTKRIGLIISSAGPFYGFTDKIATIIEYNNSSASIKNIAVIPDYPILDIKEDFKFNNENQIIEKYIPAKYSNRMDKKIKYLYDGKVLIKRETTYPNRSYDPSLSWDYIETFVEDFIYDSNNNLQKIVTTSHKTGNVNSITKTKEITFGNYDTSKNPFVKLGILNDYFERSLSKNNFRSRTEITYNINGIPGDKSENNWTFMYDTKGDLIVE